MYLIPQPKKIETGPGTFCLGYQSRIVLAPEIRENGMVYAGILKEGLKTSAGIVPAVTAGVPEDGDIFLALSDSLSTQEYTLTVTERGITALGGDGAGVLYAVQTLCQMAEQCGGIFEGVRIADRPDLLYRGYYLDQTRGRVLTLEQLKKTVDRLCRYKINQLQLYIEHTYLFRGFSEMWRDQTPLTAEEILALDAYCRMRHVELVPSLSSFGHLCALLSTKTYGSLCELEDSWRQPFSFLDRMRHHTVNVADGRVLPLIEGMLEEYMALFTSDKFNICADETFDLGKGKAKALAEKNGVHRIYIDYVRELCTFLTKRGKQPMFWGDVICGEPELVRELPEETVCLTWGYLPDQRDYESRVMAEAGAKQYLCPGVCGWNEWMNRIGDSYQNIVRMCSYAGKYHALGVLNTDWGDFGHINHPEYSVPGMIYGAAFSWNQEAIPFEEINRRIARVEYHDRTETVVGLLAEIVEHELFGWHAAVLYYEVKELGEPEELLKDVDIKGLLADTAEKTAEAAKSLAAAANEKLRGLRGQLQSAVAQMDSAGRGLMEAWDLTIDGIAIWNEIGVLLAGELQGCGLEEAGHGRAEEGMRPEGVFGTQACFGLAERLEIWFMHYKALWRSVSLESELNRISEIVFWYADLLRGRERKKRRDVSC